MIADPAIGRGFLRFTSDGPDLSAAGEAWLDRHGIDVAALRKEPRRLVRLCPDWTYRFPHLGGSVGAAILRGISTNGWFRRSPKNAVVMITPKGVAGLRRELGIELHAVSN